MEDIVRATKNPIAWHELAAMAGHSLSALHKFRRVLSITLGLLAAAASLPAHAVQIWGYDNEPCSESYCPGWIQDSVALETPWRISVSDGGVLFLIDNTCDVLSRTAQTGWVVMTEVTGYHRCPNQISARGGVYLLLGDGEVDMWVGGFSSTTGYFQKIDINPAIVTIAAGGGANEVYELLNTGAIMRYTGSSWQQLDNNPATTQIAAGLNEVYQLHDDGGIWRYTGTPCSGNACPGWTQLDDNIQALEIVADSYNNLYQLHFNGQIWKSTGAACGATGCPGWTLMDDNATAMDMAASQGALYELDTTGQIWQHISAICDYGREVCSGWEMLDDNPATGRIAAGGGTLYQVHESQIIHVRLRLCYECMAYP